jgi:transposase InsO family protein
LITKALQKGNSKKNWILRDGKNKYRKVIDPTRPNQLWTGDWKEIKIQKINSVVYIFIIIDAYTRQITGYSVSLIKNTDGALKAAKMAVNSLKGDLLFQPDKLIMHTDQGSAYISEEYCRYWKNMRVKLSYADPGKPTQNPYSEGFISLLSRFCLRHHALDSLAELYDLVSKFIKDYNESWLHEKLDDLSPNQRWAMSKKHP